MYIRKSWHDSRHRLAVYAGACLVIGVIGGIQHVHFYNQEMAYWQTILAFPPHSKLWHPDPALLRRWHLEFVQNSWKGPFYSSWMYMPMAGLWSAIIFGATSVGREYSAGGMWFALTRPQSRWSVVWHEWALAIAEICVILFMFFTGALPFALYTSPHYVNLADIPVMLLLGIVAVAACLCGLTQFLTLMMGSSMKGLSATIAVLLFYYFLPTALAVWWHIQWPEQVQALSFLVLNLPWNRDQLPILEVTAIWMLVALIFPFLSQWLIERREV